MKTTAAQNVSASVETTSGSTPKDEGVNSGVQPRAGDEVDEVDLAEELDRRLEQRDDDPDGRCDREPGAGQQDDLDARFTPAPTLRAQTWPRALELDVSSRHSLGSAGDRVAGAEGVAAVAAASNTSSAVRCCSADSGTNSATSAISEAFSR